MTGRVPGPAERELVVDGQPARVVFDLLNAPRPEVDGFLHGYTSGFLAGEAVGFRRGYAACDVEIAVLQRRAARQVHALATLDPHVDHVVAVRRRQVEAAQRMDSQLAALGLRGEVA